MAEPPEDSPISLEFLAAQQKLLLEQLGCVQT